MTTLFIRLFLYPSCPLPTSIPHRFDIPLCHLTAHATSFRLSQWLEWLHSVMTCSLLARCLCFGSVAWMTPVWPKAGRSYPSANHLILVVRSHQLIAASSMRLLLTVEPISTKWASNKPSWMHSKQLRFDSHDPYYQLARGIYRLSPMPEFTTPSHGRRSWRAQEWPTSLRILDWDLYKPP